MCKMGAFSVAACLLLVMVSNSEAILVKYKLRSRPRVTGSVRQTLRA